MKNNKLKVFETWKIRVRKIGKINFPYIYRSFEVKSIGSLKWCKAVVMFPEPIGESARGKKTEGFCIARNLL